MGIQCPYHFQSELIKKLNKCSSELESSQCKKCLEFTIDLKKQCREGKMLKEDLDFKRTQQERMCEISCKQEAKKKIEDETKEWIECISIQIENLNWSSLLREFNGRRLIKSLN